MAEMENVIGDYLFLSLIPTIAAIIIGGSVGFAYAVLIQRLLARAPSIQRWITIIPWRAPVFSLPLLLLVTMIIPLVVFDFGLGIESGIAGVGATSLLFAVPLSASVFLGQWSPRPLHIKLWAAARSLLVASLVLGVFTARVGASGVGQPFFAATGFDAAYQSFWQVFRLALACDLVLGMGEAVLWNQPWLGYKR